MLQTSKLLWNPSHLYLLPSFSRPRKLGERKRKREQFRERQREDVSNVCENVGRCVVNMSDACIVHRDRRDHGASSRWYWGSLFVAHFQFVMFFLFSLLRVKIAFVGLGFVPGVELKQLGICGIWVLFWNGFYEILVVFCSLWISVELDCWELLFCKKNEPGSLIYWFIWFFLNFL